MKIKQRTKVRFQYKEVVQKFVAMVMILAFTLTICVVPSTGAKTRTSKKPNTLANRSVKPSQQPEKGLNDPNLDTITVTNHNVGNFNKGFAGDGAVSAISSNPFYKLDVIAKTGVAGFTSVLSGSTVSGNGSVLFAGSTAQGATVFVGDSVNPARPIANPTTGAVYGGAVQLTDNNKSISWFSVPGAQSLIVRDSLVPSVAPLVATNLASAADRFDQVNAFASVNRFAQPVFSGVRNNAVTMVSGYRFGYTFLKTYAAGNGGTLRPMVSDNGVVVVREIEAGQVQRLVLFNYGLVGITQTIADENRFNSIGTSPGISDEGSVVVFQGDLKPDGGSTTYNSHYQTTSGPGIFASIDVGGGDRQLKRLAGIQSEDLSSTTVDGDGICEVNEVCIKDELGYDATGLPIRFDIFDPNTRVGVARLELGTPSLDDDSFVATFAATPSAASPSALFSNQTGLWTIRTDVKYAPAPMIGFDFSVAKVKPVIQINDTIDGSIVQQIGIYDPISNATNDDSGSVRVARRGDHRVAFWAQTNTGAMVVRGTYFDTDEDGLPDHWEANGVTIGGQVINLPAMGSNPNHKDIFVHANWLAANGTLVFKPRAAALQRVIDAFKNSPVTNPDNVNGINIHIDAGPSSVMNPRNSAKWNSLSRAGSFPYTPTLGIPYPSTGRYNWSDFDTYKTFVPSGQTLPFLQTGRSAVFRLSFFVDTWENFNNGSSGKARSIPGTDFIISLGHHMTPQQRGVISQAGTFMHELGHTLALKHGGSDHSNYKPNYLSIMNYHFQFVGLIRSDNSAEIDYSRNTLNTLIETNLNESVGINDPQNHQTIWWSGASPGCVLHRSNITDWDGDGIPNEPSIVPVDLNGDGSGGCDGLNGSPSIDILTGQNDWPVISIDANGALGGNGAGSSGNPPVNQSSEATIAQIIAATPPDLMLRQGCEPVDETVVTISGSQAPVTVNFDASASTAPCGNIVSYSWTFGDGTTGSGAQAAHVYANQGNYLASLSLTDANGNTTLIPSKYQIAVTNDYSISGQITDASGNGLSGVTVNLSGEQNVSTQTSASGSYSFANVVSGGSYTVTPVKAGFRFGPSNRVFNNLGSSQTANFSATQGAMFPDNKRADFDGDGRSDISVFRPGNSTWYSLNRFTGNLNATAWGLSGDKLTPGDYDGDGKTDLAVFRPSDRVWYILQSSTNSLTALQWGLSTDIPVAGDYDGDGKTDIAVWRPSDGNWYVFQSSNQAVLIVNYGQNGDVPLVGDFDGDRKTDFAFFNPSQTPSSATWNILRSTGGTVVRPFGLFDDKLVPADFDGDGTTDFGVWRPSNGFWYTAPSSELDPSHNFTAIPFGLNGDIPVPGDYDGDGKYDRGIFRNGVWYIPDFNNSISYFYFGLGTDKPIATAYVPQ
ncbi:MAG: PKD domain-containing protein [Pyrinomonadaceae bacterium]